MQEQGYYFESSSGCIDQGCIVIYQFRALRLTLIAIRLSLLDKLLLPLSHLQGPPVSQSPRTKSIPQNETPEALGKDSAHSSLQRDVHGVDNVTVTIVDHTLRPR